MSKLAVIDLDGVLADSSVRIALAQEVEADYLDEEARHDLTSGTKQDWNEVKKKATNLYWQTAFNPELISLDTLIPGALEALDALSQKGYALVYLTSRPESLRDATKQWLDLQGVMIAENITATTVGEDVLVMKAPAFQFVKTPVWKAGMIQTMVSLCRATDIVFIDDEQANHETVRQASTEEELQRIWPYSSLQEAVEELQERA